ncbi:MAG: hypothetical protein HKO71_07090 [Pseudomonadales bacterium]|nr:TraR/DksA C4-type zinc finger protein [Gammaproteobacteria bacterium]NNL57501.1 hypothetical protein [Pseudomonadales bacterium]
MTDDFSQADKQELAAHIDRQLQALLQEQQRAEVDGQPVQLDQQSVGRVSRIDAIQQQQMALARLAQLQQRRAALQQARQALQSDDDYGYCEQCDALIPLARLKIDPAARCCVGCAD